MNNSQILAAILSHWVEPMAGDIAAMYFKDNAMLNGINFYIKKWVPVSESYSVTDELSWMIKPVTKSFIEPFINTYTAKIPDDKIPELANNMVDAMIQESRLKGHVTIAEKLQFEESDLTQLKKLIELNFPIPEAPQIILKTA